MLLSISPTFRKLDSSENKILNKLNLLEERNKRLEKKLYNKSDRQEEILFILFKYIMEVNKGLKLDTENIRDYVERNKRYYDCLKGYPDIVNPKTYNEKVQWWELFDRKDIYTTISDKYTARAYIKNNIGEEYLVPMLFKTEQPEEIPFDTLPDEFVIKPTHLSGAYKIIRNKSEISKNEIITLCNKWLKINYYDSYARWYHKNMKPSIIIEKLLKNEKGDIPDDYKFHCFSGKVKIIQVDVDRLKNHTRGLYDKDWKILPFSWGFPTTKKAIEKPEALDKAIHIAEKLSKNFDAVRIDQYIIGNKIYQGEISLGHGNGMEKFTPEAWGREIGDMWKLKIPE